VRRARVKIRWATFRRRLEESGTLRLQLPFAGAARCEAGFSEAEVTRPEELAQAAAIRRP